MKVKLTESQLRAIIQESISEATLQRGDSLRIDQYRFKTCDLSALNDIVRDDGSRVFSDKAVKGFEFLFRGATPAACNLINAGFKTMAIILGYAGGGSTGSIDRLKVEKFVDKAKRENKDNTAVYNEKFSELTNLFLPEMMQSINRNETKQKIKEALKSDLNTVKRDYTALLNARPEARMPENYDLFANLFKFENLRDYKEFRDKVSETEEKILSKGRFPSNKIRIEAYNKLIKDNDHNKLLSDYFEDIVSNLESFKDEAGMEGLKFALENQANQKMLKGFTNLN